MTEINLLPWRETVRNAAKKEFLIIFTLILGLAVFVLFMALNKIKTQLQRLQALNTDLQQKIAILEPKMSAIATIKIELNNLSAKRDVLEKLQLQRKTVVHLLEQVVYQIPAEVYLTRFDKKDVQLTFEGVAESNARVSEFMQKIAQSQWIAEQNLVEIKAVDNKQESKGYYFKMTARCVMTMKS